MTTNPHNPTSSAPFPGSAEETLRVVAGLPAPAGLEDRMRAAIHLARNENFQRQENSSGPNGPGPNVYGNVRRGRVLAWPSALKPQAGWMRTAAAAAIVFVVAGGGWGVYTRVEQNRPAKILVMPPRIGAPGGFSGAGAVRTPETLTRPTVSVAAKPAVSTAIKPATPATVTAQGKSAKNAAPKAAVKSGKAAAATPAQ
jgi:hypothetical protein